MTQVPICWDRRSNGCALTVYIAAFRAHLHARNFLLGQSLCMSMAHPSPASCPCPSPCLVSPYLALSMANANLLIAYSSVSCLAHTRVNSVSAHSAHILGGLSLSLFSKRNVSLFCTCEPAFTTSQNHLAIILILLLRWCLRRPATVDPRPSTLDQTGLFPVPWCFL